MDEVIGLFPTPFLRAPAALPRPLVQRLIESFAGLAVEGNKSSPRLTHTELLRPQDDPLLMEACERIGPKLIDFGALLFGERLDWSVKEIWVNVLETGGRQATHNHANSFVSGVVYLTPMHPSSYTVFMKSPGGTDFVFKNDHAGVTGGQFSSDQWISPQPVPGDLVLFPSYLMHAVPPNAESWGYTIRLGA
jgi:hypothetical protein